jgi:hypothetical protein
MAIPPAFKFVYEVKKPSYLKSGRINSLYTRPK